MDGLIEGLDCELWYALAQAYYEYEARQDEEREVYFGMAMAACQV